MTTGALIFLILVWSFVLGLTIWSYRRLLRMDPAKEPLPPPGTSL